MSFTETQTVPPRPTFYDDEHDDHGLIMKLDSRKVGPIRRPGILKKSLTMPISFSSGIGVPVPAKFCGKSPELFAGWALLSASLVQNIPESLLKKLYKINETLQHEISLLAPYLLYLSFLVLALQGLGVMALLIGSFLPLGLWFLLTCGIVLGGLFCTTTIAGAAQASQSSPPPTPSHSSTNLSSMCAYN